MEQQVTKEYVTITAEIAPDGSMKPLTILLEDGRRFEIDEVTDVRRAASLKAGGCGMRYSIRIGASRTFLFDEDGRWFVARKS